MKPFLNVCIITVPHAPTSKRRYGGLDDTSLVSASLLYDDLIDKLPHVVLHVPKAPRSRSEVDLNRKEAEDTEYIRTLFGIIETYKKVYPTETIFLMDVHSFERSDRHIWDFFVIDEMQPKDASIAFLQYVKDALLGMGFKYTYYDGSGDNYIISSAKSLGVNCFLFEVCDNLHYDKRQTIMKTMASFILQYKPQALHTHNINDVYRGNTTVEDFISKEVSSINFDDIDMDTTTIRNVPLSSIAVQVLMQCKTLYTSETNPVLSNTESINLGKYINRNGRKGLQQRSSSVYWKPEFVRGVDFVFISTNRPTNHTQTTERRVFRIRKTEKTRGSCCWYINVLYTDKTLIRAILRDTPRILDLPLSTWLKSSVYNKYLEDIRGVLARVIYEVSVALRLGVPSVRDNSAPGGVPSGMYKKPNMTDSDKCLVWVLNDLLTTKEEREGIIKSIETSTIVHVIT